MVPVCGTSSRREALPGQGPACSLSVSPQCNAWYSKRAGCSLDTQTAPGLSGSAWRAVRRSAGGLSLGRQLDSSTFSKRGPRLLLTASDTHLKDRPAGLFLYRVCDEKKVQKEPSTQWTLDKWQVLPDCLHSGYKERNEGLQNLRVSGARTCDRSHHP